METNIHHKQGHDNDTDYVLEKSTQISESNLESIRRSIENERTKSGILLGFFFLMVVDGLKYFVKLPNCAKIIASGFLIFSLYNLIASFVSVKMADGVNVGKNFEEDWANRKRDFWKFYYQTIKQNCDNQKNNLEKNSNRNRNAVIGLTVIISILFLFNAMYAEESPQNNERSYIQSKTECCTI